VLILQSRVRNIVAHTWHTNWQWMCHGRFKLHCMLRWVRARPHPPPTSPFPTIVRPLGRVRGPHRRGWPGALTPRSVTQSFGGAASRGPNPFDTCVRRPPEVSGGAARLVPSRRSSNPTALSRGICYCRGTCTLMVSGGSVGNENLQVQRLQLSSTFCGTHAQCVRVANRERTERPAALGAVRRRGI